MAAALGQPRALIAGRPNLMISSGAAGFFATVLRTTRLTTFFVGCCSSAMRQVSHTLERSLGAKVRREVEDLPMGTDQYHEPANELLAQMRTFARMCANLTEEAEAIGWYEQRISIEPDPVSRAIMRDSLGEQFKHFSMELEFLLRQRPQWRSAEEPKQSLASDSSTSLGIGSLKGATS